MQFETLIVEEKAGVAKIVLNRPDQAHAINLQMAKDVHQAALFCEESESVRAVLLTSTGKMFCAGGDLSSFAEADNVSQLLKEITFYFHAAISCFARMDAPLVVAVNGVAAGAGFSIALLGDLTLASASARFTMAYTAVGLTPDGGSTFNLPRLIGEKRAKELMLTNRRLSAEEALDWGLVNQIFPDDQLEEEAEALAAGLAKGPTRAFGAVKSLLLTQENLEAQLDREARSISERGQGEDGSEGVRAFLAKRKPTYSGKN